MADFRFKTGDRVRRKTDDREGLVYSVEEDLAEGVTCEWPPGGKDNRRMVPAEDLVLVAPAKIFAALHALSVEDGYYLQFPAHTDPAYMRDDFAHTLAQAAHGAIAAWHLDTLTSADIDALGRAVVAYETAWHG